ncbi:MAG: response regulator [Saprospiraceae bacterium]|nr:response regulator [Saprospiraceae bacterium]
MSAQINILIVEDEPLYSSKLEMQLEQTGYQVVGCAENSDTALSMIRLHRVDLIVMDIHIQGSYDGIELSEQIQNFKNIPVIYLTSLEDEMTFNRAARTQPAGFLLKPCTDIQLHRTIQLALKGGTSLKIDPEEQELVQAKSDDLFIQKNQTIHRVPFHSIFFLEADGRYCRIHSNLGLFLVRKPLKELLEILPDRYFAQSHRSFVINLSKIEKINLEDDVILINGKSVPVSKREKEQVLERLRLIK